MGRPPLHGANYYPHLTSGPAPSPSGLAHSAWLWPCHLPPWHWQKLPGNCGSVPPAEPAGPEALQPADTSAQGRATPRPARPLPFSPCEEAAPEDGALGLHEKEEPKAPWCEAKTHGVGVGAQRPGQRQTWAQKISGGQDMASRGGAEKQRGL